MALRLLPNGLLSLIEPGGQTREKGLHKARRLVYPTLTSKTVSRRRLRLSLVIRIGGNGGCAGSSS